MTRGNLIITDGEIIFRENEKGDVYVDDDGKINFACDDSEELRRVLDWKKIHLDYHIRKKEREQLVREEIKKLQDQHVASLKGIMEEHTKMLNELKSSAQPKEKQPQVLFKTHDGKEIHDGDDVWFMWNEEDLPDTKKFDIEHCVANKDIWYYHSAHLSFSSKELADQYVLHHKPYLSLSDISNLMNGINFSKAVDIAKQKQNIKD